MYSKNIFWLTFLNFLLLYIFIAFYITNSIYKTILLIFIFVVCVITTRFWGTFLQILSRFVGKAFFIIPQRIIKIIFHRNLVLAQVDKLGNEIPYYYWDYEKTRKTLLEMNYKFFELRIDNVLMDNYVKDAKYSSRFSSYYKKSPLFLKHKQIQHLCTLQICKPELGQVWMDVASSSSPFPDIMRFLYKQEIYQQDLIYNSGVYGYKIGSNASSIPLPDASVDVITLHCSFEHFEHESDKGFILEAKRILRENGSILIVPIYLANKHTILTNPKYFLTQGLPKNEENCLITLSRLYWESHGRFYDAETLDKRILEIAKEIGFEVSFYNVTSEKEFNYPTFSVLRLQKWVA